MGTVHTNGVTKFLQVVYIPEINYQVIIAIHVTALGQDHLLITRFYYFLGRIEHVLPRKELCLFHINYFPGSCSSHQQIGLAA